MILDFNIILTSLFYIINQYKINLLLINIKYIL